MSPLVGVALMVALIAANALFVAAEFALVAVRRGPVEERAAAGERRARATLAAMRNLSFVLSGAQFGITATSLLVGFLAEPALGRLLAPLVETAGVPPGSTMPVAFTTAFVLATAVQMVLGELAPKNLAISRPETVALALGGFIRIYGRLFGPVIRLFDGSAARLSRVLGVEPQDELLGGHSREELARIIAASEEEGLLSDEQAELLLRAVELGDRRVGEIMVPRPDVAWLDADDPLDALRRAARRTGHSRFPVRGSSDDDVVGTVHVKDLLGVPRERWPTTTVAEVAALPLVVPEGQTLRALLAALRTGQRTFAVVADEFGGTAGIVTVEDVVEELVGEIEDEFDRDAVTLRRVGPGRYLVSGGVRADRLGALLGIELPSGQFDTVAGFVIDRLGRIPEPGDAVTHGGWELSVWRMDGRRVTEVLLRRTDRGRTGRDAAGEGT